MQKAEKMEQLLTAYRKKPTYENYLAYKDVKSMPDDTVFPDEKPVSNNSEKNFKKNRRKDEV